MNKTRELIEAAPVKDWYDLLLRKEQYSYYIDRPFERLIKDVKWELDELLTGIQNNDSANIKEEVADVIFNTCQLMQALLKRDLVTAEDIRNTWKEQKKKIYTRQPYIKENVKLNSREEETALFKKLKENAHTSWMSWSMLKDNSNW